MSEDKKGMKVLEGSRYDRVRGVDPFREYRDVPVDGGPGILAVAMYESMKGNKNAASDAIEWSEKEGQRRLARSEKLPVDGTKGHEDQWRAMGIDLGPVEQGELFRDADFPPGWEIQPTNHSMWSNLVDDKGSIRAMMFYKAAFYDRSAHIRPHSRFSIEGCFYHETSNKTHFEVKDARKPSEPLFSAPLPPHPGFDAPWEERDAYYKAEEAASQACMDWLSKHYPDYEDPNAYWDTE